MEIQNIFKYHASTSCRDNQGNTPLHMACEEDRLSTAYILLDMGNADPTSLNNEEKTPFQMASDSLQMKLRSRKSRRYA